MRRTVLLIAAATLPAETGPTAGVLEFRRALEKGRSDDATTISRSRP